MDTSVRGTAIAGVILIGVGVLFLVLNLLPGIGFGQTWPVIFFVMALGFFVPAFVWKEYRKGLAGLFIPGGVMLALGLIFLYNTISGDWASWAYAWLLIPGGVGLGLAMGGGMGEWGRGALLTGLWMLAASAGLFALFATIFGGPFLRIFGPVLVMLVGGLLLLRAFRK